MKEVYAALLLDSADKEVNEKSLKKVLKATGEKPDKARIKALVSSLEGVNIQEVIKQAVVAPAPAAAPAEAKEEKPKEKKEERTEEEKEKEEEEAAEGLGSLFSS